RELPCTGQPGRASSCGHAPAAEGPGARNRDGPTEGSRGGSPENAARADDPLRDGADPLGRARPPAVAPDPHRHGHAAVGCPVRGRTSEVLGGLFLGHPEPGVFTDDAERVVVGLAAQAAIAIQNARLYEAERNARAEAEAGSRAKDEFLAMLGHELRNPLSAV